jgi:hypothetical protein
VVLDRGFGLVFVAKPLVMIGKTREIAFATAKLPPSPSLRRSVAPAGKSSAAMIEPRGNAREPQLFRRVHRP